MATLASRLPKASSLSLDTRLREERYLQRRTSPLGQDGGRSPAAGTCFNLKFMAKRTLGYNNHMHEDMLTYQLQEQESLTGIQARKTI